MVVKNVIMPIKGDTQLPLRNDQVLLYDSSNHLYYATTREELLNETYKEFKKLKESCEKRIKFLEEQYLEFLETYKETNSKMINMIEELM